MHNTMSWNEFAMKSCSQVIADLAVVITTLQATVIDPADVEGLKTALDKNNVTLFFTLIKTLHLRIQQQNTTAMKMAEVLEAHPKVDGDVDDNIRFIDSLKIPYNAPSFGDCESSL